MYADGAAESSIDEREILVDSQCRDRVANTGAKGMKTAADMGKVIENCRVARSREQLRSRGKAAHLIRIRVIVHKHPDLLIPSRDCDTTIIITR